MGSGQSARKITINNEEIGVIGISESVVDRLVQKVNESPATSKVRSSTLTESPSTTAVSPQFYQSGDTPVNSESVTCQHLTMSALKMQQQKEQELRNLDNYWRQRLWNLEQTHAKLNDILKTEYQKATEEIYINAKKGISIEDAVQPCKGTSDKVLACYQENPKEILKCSSLVDEFSNCVDKRRAQVIAEQC
ncbi:MICOS complex subunit Mic19 [Ceratina calcarata]|uniref:MICOS complex subunit Mic19 n=1 Tax=Ceratina calcarata TaxID=156304 RepID=A0AAJ7JF62_9HYME|nr:MICOS complex subunit Mic19 [Ceratina calcarata]XP_017892084.1 MICOS complex subunit Mic19 [Ceratina calcarata]XP_017892085.1 MICOS complex subunit Mic19 [Ceratina calcarata]XP_017892086.1 MICOS complex subunit Mic19 [Ceratina calcarata]XP_026675169.1 MICOS complex subunit Mic19 [Ceratina calcarata]